MKLDYERGHHCSIYFDYTDVGVCDNKALLHANRWDACVNKRVNMNTGGNLVEVVGSDEKKVLWGVVDNNVV